MANKTVRIDQLGMAIAAELEGYSQDVKNRVDQAGEKAIKKMVKLTKASAPVDRMDSVMRRTLSPQL